MQGEGDIRDCLTESTSLLQRLSQKLRGSASKTENNFSAVTGILEELTETCTVATGHTTTTQKQGGVTEQVNIAERDATEEELKTMIEERKEVREGDREG